MNQGWKPTFFFANGTSSKDGMGTVPGMNKSAIFCDQSSSSRMEQLKHRALDAYKLSQPKSGPVKNETEKNSRLDAITRVRAGGYVPHKNHHQT